MTEHLSQLIDRHNDPTPHYQMPEELSASMADIVRGKDHMDIAVIGRATDRSAEYPEGRPIEAMFASTPGTEKSRPWAIVQTEHADELSATLAALLIGKVVANEPQLLDELGYNLAITPTTSPDEVALQRWARGRSAFDPEASVLGKYRPVASEQVAWGFPYKSDKYVNCEFSTPTAETLAVMGLMDQLKPTDLLALHTNPALDAYFFSSDGSPAVLEGLSESAQRYGFHMQDSEPEMPFLKLHDPRWPGIFKPYTVEDLIRNRAGDNPVESVTLPDVGNNSFGYLSTTVVKNPRLHLSELPNANTPALTDYSLTKTTLSEAYAAVGEFTADLYGVVQENLARLRPAAERSKAPEAGRLLRSLDWWSSITAGRVFAKNTTKNREQVPTFLTRSQHFGIELGKFFSLGFAGQTHSLAEIIGNKEVAGITKQEITSRLQAFTTEFPLEPYPLNKMVAAQALAGLVALSHGPGSRS